jgi:hypothetical protein
MKAGYLPEDFRRPPLTVLPTAQALPLRQPPDPAEPVPEYEPPTPAATNVTLPDRVELRYPPQHGESPAWVYGLWQAEECDGDLFAGLSRRFTNDPSFWTLIWYDCDTQEESDRFTSTFQTQPIDISPSGRTVLTRSEDGRFDLWSFSGEHVLGFRPQWPLKGRAYSLNHNQVAIVDDERFLQCGESREIVLRQLPDGKAVYRIAGEIGDHVSPTPDRRTLMLCRRFGWDVLDVDSGEITQRIPLPEDLRAYHHAVFSPSLQQVALILPVELPRDSRQDPESPSGRLARSLAVVDTASGCETMRVSLPQRYRKIPLWVSEDYLLINAPYNGISEPELHTQGDQHLLIHAPTGWTVWRFLTEKYQEQVRYTAGVRGVWSTRSADPRTGQAGWILAQPLLTPQILEAADKQLNERQLILGNRRRLALDVEVGVPSETGPLSLLVYTWDSGCDRFAASSESINRHFKRLVEEQKIVVDPHAEHCLSVKIAERPLDELVDREFLCRFRFGAIGFASAELLDEQLKREGNEIHATRVTCCIAISDVGGKQLAAVKRTFDTFDSGLRDTLILHPYSIRGRIQENVWQAAIEWCLNQSAQAILYEAFDKRQLPTTRLDGTRPEERKDLFRFPAGLPAAS